MCSIEKEELHVKTKRLVLISCFAAAAVTASPALGEPQKKSVVTSTSRLHRVGPQSAQVTPTHRYATNWQHGGTRYSGGTRSYGGSPYYGGNQYYGGNRYYYSGGFGYPYYNYSYWPYSYYGYYPNSYSYYENNPYAYSHYSEPAYGYDASLVAQVQRRLGELGYYHGVIDGIMGPQARAATSAYEDTHNLVVDGMISPRLLDRMGLA